MRCLPMHSSLVAYEDMPTTKICKAQSDQLAISGKAGTEQPDTFNLTLRPDNLLQMVTLSIPVQLLKVGPQSNRQSGPSATPS